MKIHLHGDWHCFLNYNSIFHNLLKTCQNSMFLESAVFERGLNNIAHRMTDVPSVF